MEEPKDSVDKQPQPEESDQSDSGPPEPVEPVEPRVTEDNETPAPGSQRPATPWARLSAQFESASGIVKAVAVAAVACYALGYLISSIHLVGSGVAERPALRPDHILKGIAFLAAVAAPIMIGLAAWQGFKLGGSAELESHSRLRTLVSRCALGLLGGFLVACLAAIWMYRVLPPLPIMAKKGDLAEAGRFGFAIIVISYLALTYLNIRPRGRWTHTFFRHFGISFARLVRRCMLIMLFSAIPAVIWSYSYFAYPLIDRACGGGSPVVADIVLSPQGLRAMGTLGLDCQDTGMLLRASVIHESAKDYFILASGSVGEDRRVVRLPKSLTLGSAVGPTSRPASQPATGPAP